MINFKSHKIFQFVHLWGENYVLLGRLTNRISRLIQMIITLESNHLLTKIQGASLLDESCKVVSTSGRYA